MKTDFSTAPLASGLRGADGGTVEKSQRAPYTKKLTLQCTVVRHIGISVDDCFYARRLLVCRASDDHSSVRLTDKNGPRIPPASRLTHLVNKNGRASCRDRWWWYWWLWVGAGPLN